jgi:hypothetical protein
VIIRLLLVASALALLVLLFRGSGIVRQRAVRRLAALAFVAAWITAVLAPDVVTRLANAVGVGRGTDLVLYVLVVVVIAVAVGIQQRFARLEERISALVRELALRDAGTASPRPVAGLHESLHE